MPQRLAQLTQDHLAQQQEWAARLAALTPLPPSPTHHRRTATTTWPSGTQLLCSTQDLAAALDTSLKDMDDSGVVPSSTYVVPNSRSRWRTTAAAMMPGIKRRKGPAGDKVYGGGVSSGRKAPKRRKEARTDTLPVNVPYATPISVQQAHAFPVAPSTHSFRTNSATTQDASPNIHPQLQMVTPVPHYYLPHAPYMSAAQYYPPYFYPPSQM
ncbi:hypothetical protein DFH08DRAFT_1002070 [Mycena albidolilacea]|uniref:Uncharacterized protein n=1 Tax=Mycena albidolilacea TaxID=1033008 RepID=A0AAD7A235_9AGAR|nr:hypothetical protein DFH08DRAFT_1002070 [Mycena albidolilacea]